MSLWRKINIFETCWSLVQIRVEWCKTIFGVNKLVRLRQSKHFLPCPVFAFKYDRPHYRSYSGRLHILTVRLRNNSLRVFKRSSFFTTKHYFTHKSFITQATARTKNIVISENDRKGPLKNGATTFTKTTLHNFIIVILNVIMSNEISYMSFCSVYL